MSESFRSVSLYVFLRGDPGEFVPHVNVSTVDGTAISKCYNTSFLSHYSAHIHVWYYTIYIGSGAEADYNPVKDQSISFTILNNNQSFNVQLRADGFIEMSETFFALLTSAFLAEVAGGDAIDISDQESARLILNPDTANVTILDDDGNQFYFFR